MALCLIKLKASRGRGCVRLASDKEKTSQCWTGVEITNVVGKGQGHGRLGWTSSKVFQGKSETY